MKTFEEFVNEKEVLKNYNDFIYDSGVLDTDEYGKWNKNSSDSDMKKVSDRLAKVGEEDGYKIDKNKLYKLLLGFRDQAKEM